MNHYLNANINYICRICLEKSGKLTPIFDPVTEGDGLPSSICSRCISKLNVAFQLKILCEASDRKLRDCLELMQRQSLSFVTDQNDAAQLSNATDYHETTNFTQLQCQDTGKEDYLQQPYIEEPNLKTEDVNSEMAKVSGKSGKTKKRSSMKPHQCNTCQKVFKTKSGLIHHIRIHTGERPYVCHLCQKRFANGGHLHTHMKTHTGEKNHICAACSKGFATAQQLTKHTIAIHTSERPYGCTYCPKRFANSSNLNTHLKIHTGEKNFHCEVCGKMFSTKGQLLQHMVVHTGERSFLCEFCFKRFAQKAHLVRHFKIHERSGGKKEQQDN